MPLGTIYFLGFYKKKVNVLRGGGEGGEGGLPQFNRSERVEKVTLYLLTSIFLCSEQRFLDCC